MVHYNQSVRARFLLRANMWLRSGLPHLKNFQAAFNKHSCFHIQIQKKKTRHRRLHGSNNSLLFYKKSQILGNSKKQAHTCVYCCNWKEIMFVFPERKKSKSLYS